MFSSTEPEAVERSVLIASTALTGLMVLEYAWNMRFEIRVIWPRRVWKSAEAKIFVIARYIGITGQICNVGFAIRMASGIPIHPLACKAWSSYGAITIHTLFLSVELLLMLLVRKMYNSDKYFLGMLLTFFGGQFTVMTVAARMIVPELKFSPMCIVTSSHPGQVYAGASHVVTNSCILAMILWRYFRGNWLGPPHPYLKIVFRDSICTTIVVIGIFIFVTFMPLVFGQSHIIINTIFHVILFCFWFAAGRLVLGKEKFLQESRESEQFTEVDLDNLEGFEDLVLFPARQSSCVPLEASITVGPKLGVEME